MNNDLTGYLTPKQQKFCDEYLIDLNATRAALRAGYSSSTALSGALMRIPKIAAYLQQRTAAVSREAGITHKMVLTELGKIAFSNMANYYHKDGSLKGVHELTPDEAAALWCLKVSDGKDGQSTFIRLNNKLSALEKIARHLGFYTMEEAEEPEKEYVIVAKDELTDDDRFDDDSFDEEEKDEDEEEDYEEMSEEDEINSWFDDDESERDRVLRMILERQKLVHFYPKLDEILPSDRFLTDEMILAALKLMKPGDTLPRGLVLRCVERGELKEVTDGAPEMEEEESPVSESRDEEVAVAAPVRAGGVIDFGTSKKGTCKVPLMMGNSKEYGSW